jgi:hypothetical protein
MQLSSEPTAYANSAEVLVPSRFLCLFLFEFTSFFKDKSHKEVKKQ